MKKLLEKSAIGCGIVASFLIGTYVTLFVADKISLPIRSFIIILFVIILFVFLFLYIWNSYDLLKEKDLLEKINLEKENKLKNQIEINDKLKENNKGLLDERSMHKLELKEKDIQIESLNIEITKLENRVISNERSNNIEL